MIRSSILITFFVLLTGASTCKKGEPPPPRVKLFVGDSEVSGICRENDDGIIECVYASAKDFDNYQCATSEDVNAIAKYISDLRAKCTSFETTDK